MRALILAAGMGWRLGGGREQPPKSLLRFAGRSLLERHLALLFGMGIERVHIGVGYRAQLIEDEIARLGVDAVVETIYNPEFERGNIVTLWRMREHLGAGGSVLLMDADVLYDHRIMRKLVDSRHQNCFLLDRDIEPGDEPVKLCVREGRIVEFGKVVDPSVAYDLHGESVGFFKLRESSARTLGVITERYVAQERVDAFYEDALRDLLLASDGEGFGYEDVTGLPWIEIDFQDDIARAEREVVPRLADVIGAGSANALVVE